MFGFQKIDYFFVKKTVLTSYDVFFVIFLKISIKLLITDLQMITTPPFVMFFNKSIWYLGLFHVKMVNFSFLTSYDVIIDIIFVIFLKISTKLLIIELQTTTIPPFVMLFNESIWYLGLFYVKISNLSILKSYDVIFVIFYQNTHKITNIWPKNDHDTSFWKVYPRKYLISEVSLCKK